MSEGLVLHADGRARCWWPGADPLYVAYHDTEWGVPERDGRALFEKLILDGFQAGLSWITILRKREAFRRGFAGFDPQAIAAFGPDRVEALMQEPGIVRNRAKIEGTIASARAWLDMGGPHAPSRASSGNGSTAAPCRAGERPAPTSRRRPTCRGSCRASSRQEASRSAGRPSCMPFFRRPGW